MSTKTKKAPKSLRMSKSAARAEGAAKAEASRETPKVEVKDAGDAAVVFRDGGAFHWRRGDSVSAKSYADVNRAALAARASNRGAKVVVEDGADAETPKNATIRPGRAKVPKEKRPSGLDLAAKALASAKEPLSAKDIAERAVSGGWKTSGKTPHATLYAAMIREIAARGKDARFRKTGRGLFAAGKVA